MGAPVRSTSIGIVTLGYFHSQSEIKGRRPKLREKRRCSTGPRLVLNVFLAELGLPRIDSMGPRRYGDLCPQVGVLHPRVHKGLARNFLHCTILRNLVETLLGD